MPRKWTKQFNVQKGDELEVQEEGNRLSVMTESTITTKEITVDVSGLTPRLVDRFLARAYQKGYDTITIRYDNPEQAITIQDKVKELLGFEIMEQNKDAIIIKSISQKLNIEFDPSLRRCFLILLDMAQTCMEAFSKGDKNTLENLYHKDFDLNKFCYFCLRSIRKGNVQNEFGSYILYYLIENLEDAGDEYKALAVHLSKVSGKKKKNLISLLSKVNEMAKIAYEFFYKPEKEKAVRSITLYNEVREEIRKMLSTRDVNEAAALNSLDIIARIVYHYPTMRLDTLEGFGG